MELRFLLAFALPIRRPTLDGRYELVGEPSTALLRHAASGSSVVSSTFELLLGRGSTGTRGRRASMIVVRWSRLVGVGEFELSNDAALDVVGVVLLDLSNGQGLGLIYGSARDGGPVRTCSCR